MKCEHIKLHNRYSFVYGFFCSVTFLRFLNFIAWIISPSHFTPKWYLFILLYHDLYKEIGKNKTVSPIMFIQHSKLQRPRWVDFAHTMQFSGKFFSGYHLVSSNSIQFRHYLPGYSNRFHRLKLQFPRPSYFKWHWQVQAFKNSGWPTINLGSVPMAALFELD